MRQPKESLYFDLPLRPGGSRHGENSYLPRGSAPRSGYAARAVLPEDSATAIGPAV